ncbi:golgin subfamily A member 7 [Aphis gossypii]|uniref:Ras modification protein ERF4 n=1 Tax=Aphis craccivora TaxID=307492 RepID=A0A6G0YNZ2_APHCR|nr:golgin subfamily A member 7 [Aphis gossypii]KAF0759350.1 golgin subfamily A member 7 [Aphis craccivora]
MSPPTIRSSQGNTASQAQGPQYAKVFVQRDYSDGTTVKFMTSFPQGLENKIERSVFEYTINQLNTYFAEAEKASCKTYCEGCFACFTVYTMFLCADTHYEKCLRKVGKFIVEQNEMVYLPRGLLLTNPAERGLRIIEITMLDQPIVART